MNLGTVFEHLLPLAAAPTTPAAPAPDMGISSGLIITLVIVGVFVIVLLWAVVIYNLLVALRNRVKAAWAQIDVQLKRRYDLIPNLVEIVKGYAKHEEGTLTKVIEARNQAQGALKELGKLMANTGGFPAAANGVSASDMPSPMGNKGAGAGPMGLLVQAEGILAGAMQGLTVTIERYPDLKANENFMQLQEELTSTENKVAFARQHYNQEVMVYNTKREVIPNIIVANIGGFRPAEEFRIDEAQREAPKVQF